MSVSLVINGFAADISAEQVPTISEKTCELLKEKYASLVEGDHQKKVVDLTRLIGANNQTKAKIVSVLLTAAAIAALAVGAFFAISGFMVATYSVTGMKLLGGLLVATICMSANRVKVSKYLGTVLPRPETIPDSFRTFFDPVRFAFTAKESLIINRSKSVQDLFEA